MRRYGRIWTSSTAVASASTTSTAHAVEAGVRIAHVVWHVRFIHLVEWQQRVTRRKLRVARHKNRRQHRTLHALVVIRIDAYLLLLGAKRILTRLDRLQLVVTLKIRPTPHSAVDDMRKTFTVRHLQRKLTLTLPPKQQNPDQTNLQPPVQRARNRHTLRGRPRAGQRPLQLLDRALSLLQLLHQTIDRLFGPLFLLVALLPAEQLLHGRARERKQRVQRGHGATTRGLHIVSVHREEEICKRRERRIGKI